VAQSAQPRLDIEATRQAAGETGAVLCDAAAAFDANRDRGMLFQADGIHLTAAGERALVDVLVPCVRRAAGQALPGRNAERRPNVLRSSGLASTLPDSISTLSFR
jgi:hypothetical protein